MGIDDQTSDLIVFIGNEGLPQERFKWNLRQRHPRRDHLLGAGRSDPGQPVAGARRRCLRHQFAQIVE